MAAYGVQIPESRYTAMKIGHACTHNATASKTTPDRYKRLSRRASRLLRVTLHPNILHNYMNVLLGALGHPSEDECTLHVKPRTKNYCQPYGEVHVKLFLRYVALQCIHTKGELVN